MRKTGSVTQVEVPLSDSDQLVSATTPKGVITDANDDFCRIAGFTRDELIGQAHNIVRHQDMPSAAFKLLWDTIKQGKPWRGIVKNRCKNGDHYWVDAYVMPTFEHGEIISFESVRQKARPEWIKRAEEVYTNLNNNKAALPWYPRFIEKYLHWWVTAPTALLFAIPTMLLVDIAGMILGPLFFLALMTTTYLFTRDDSLNRLLSAYNSDDLTQYIYTGHLHRNVHLELLDSFFNRHLHTVLERMDQQGEILTDMSSENSQRASQQFNAIEDERVQMDGVASAVQELSHSIQEIAKHSESSANSTNEANAITREGLDELNAADQQVEDLVNTMNQSLKTVNNLIADSEEIRSVISVISSIAEQTNLLALNAAIEAARAGEQGRGFAVVADEVRSLASKTQESTSSIADIINKLVNATEKTAQTIQAGTEISRQSKETMASVKTSITSLASAIESINTNTETIADLSGQQATAADEISRNSETVLNLTEELAESAQQTLDFSDRLAQQSHSQSILINRFRH